MGEKQRRIAIFTDAHGLLEPTQAALEDMHRRGITEIYSLGDNIGVGPNPKEVLDLLEEYSVRSIAGNACEYFRLGLDFYSAYLSTLQKQSHLWTLSKLNEHQKGVIKLFPCSIELLVGGKKLALCHFANDVRCDFVENNTWTYQNSIKNGLSGYGQFNNTNSKSQLRYLEKMCKYYGSKSPIVKGYLSAKDNPLFAGNRVDFFDAIIQGHVHFKLYEASGSTEFYTIRAVGIAYREDPIDTASYVILEERIDGFNLEEVLVKFDREKMEYSILSSSSPDYRIYDYVCMNGHSLIKK